MKQLYATYQNHVHVGNNPLKMVCGRTLTRPGEPLGTELEFNYESWKGMTVNGKKAVLCWYGCADHLDVIHPLPFYKIKADDS